LTVLKINVNKLANDCRCVPSHLFSKGLILVDAQGTKNLPISSKLKLLR